MGKEHGNKHEREVANIFTEWWCDVPRKEKHIWRADMNRTGVGEHPGDIATSGVCDHGELSFTVEVKKRKKNTSNTWKFKNLLVTDNNCQILDWWDKIHRKTKEYNEKLQDGGYIPLLVFKKSYHPYYVMFNTSDLIFFNPFFTYEREGVGSIDLLYIATLDDFLNKPLREKLS